MNTRQRVLIDRLLATPIASGANLAARALGKLMGRDHAVDDGNVRTIVVAKLLGLGSIVQATPLLRALRSRFPAAKLLFVTTAPNRALCERLRMIDEVIILRADRPHELAVDVASVAARLAKQGVDLYFDLEVYSAGASLLSLASLARNRYGLYRHSARFKKGLHTHLVFLNVQAPIAESYLQLARVIDDGSAPIDSSPTEFGPIHIEASDRAGVAKVFAGAGVDAAAPYVVVNPNASDLLLERRWPLPHFAATVEALAAQGHRVVLTGSRGEKAHVAALLDLLSPAARAATLDTSGALALTELFALIEGAACVITNDTGPMHLALAFRRPMVCLFGPGGPDHYGVRRDNVVILYRNLICSPCIYETDEPPCAGNNACMQLITPSEVVAAATALLSGQPAGALPGQPVRTRDPEGHALGLVTRASLHPGRGVAS